MTQKLDDKLLRRLAGESGRLLGELGVRPQDERWIRAQAQTITSLGSKERPRGPILRLLYRLARRAARTAR